MSGFSEMLKLGLDPNKQYSKSDLQKNGVYDRLSDASKFNIESSGSAMTGAGIASDPTFGRGPTPTPTPGQTGPTPSPAPTPQAATPPPAPTAPPPTPAPAPTPTVTPTPEPKSSPAMDSLAGGAAPPTAPQPQASAAPMMASLMQQQGPDPGDVSQVGPSGLRQGLGMRSPAQYNYALASLRRGVY